jgi:hypothetical protein
MNTLFADKVDTYSMLPTFLTLNVAFAPAAKQERRSLYALRYDLICDTSHRYTESRDGECHWINMALPFAVSASLFFFWLVYRLTCKKHKK